jgi:lipopolysaccharide transport system permease protein
MTATANLSDAAAARHEKPVAVIEPGRSRLIEGLAELWDFRELLYFLTWRDVKVRYKQTLLGATWAVLQPLFAMLIFTIFFGYLAGISAQTGGIPYPLFAYAGLLLWTFFANAISNGGNSLVNSAHLITKVYFPRMIVPVAAVAAGLVDLAIAFLLLVVLMLYYGVGLTWGLALLPLYALLLTALAAGMGTWIAALNVKYRDVRHVLPFLIQLWMFVSPVIYPSSFVPEKWRWVLELNPLTGIIEGFRAALFGRDPNWRAIGIACAVTAGVLAFAVVFFRRTERRFADII